MTEAEWTISADPDAMVCFLHGLWFDDGEVPDRKLRLYACACCRRVWPQLGDPRSRRAVEAAERYADGLVLEEELEMAADAAGSVWEEEEEAERARTDRIVPPPGYPIDTYGAAAYNAAIPVGWWGAAPAFVMPDDIIRRVASDRVAEAAAQCDLLRDIFGNPFRTVVVEPAWLSPDVVGLARDIYDQHDYVWLPELATALQAAGCEQEDILFHCRADGSHVLGCWVVDLLLGKE
ncbi:MAG: hypothetical protein ACYC61_26985 [Isosphaeraceae bacterium]